MPYRNRGIYAPRKATLAERFAFYFAPPDENGCELFRGSRKGRRYATMWWEGRNQRAHRLAWRERHGPIPGGLDVCHTCDDGFCIADDHLFLGTHQDNMADKVAKGRQAQGPTMSAAIVASDRIMPRGTEVKRAKLTDDQVRTIRADPRRQIDIAADYGVTQTCISCVKRGATWRHVT